MNQHDQMREALTLAYNAMKGAIHWDKQRNFIVPYKVRDPIHAAIRKADQVFQSAPVLTVSINHNLLKSLKNLMVNQTAPTTDREMESWTDALLQAEAAIRAAEAEKAKGGV